MGVIHEIEITTKMEPDESPTVHFDLDGRHYALLVSKIVSNGIEMEMINSLLRTKKNELYFLELKVKALKREISKLED